MIRCAGRLAIKVKMVRLSLLPTLSVDADSAAAETSVRGQAEDGQDGPAVGGSCGVLLLFWMLCCVAVLYVALTIVMFHSTPLRL